MPGLPGSDPRFDLTGETASGAPSFIVIVGGGGDGGDGGGRGIGSRWRITNLERTDGCTIVMGGYRGGGEAAVQHRVVSCRSTYSRWYSRVGTERPKNRCGQRNVINWKRVL